MIRKSQILTLFCAIAILLTTSGCWSATEIQSVSYVKAMGIDFVDNQFNVYVQLLDFSNIAKSDAGGKANEQAVVWIGKGKGETLVTAISDLFKTAQFKLSWGHVSSIILTERALYAKGDLLAEMINRYPEMRYTAWIYGTKEPLDKLLAATPFFKLSPLASIMHDPQSNYKQNSTYPPMLFFQYIAIFNEPSGTAYLPSLSLNDTQWEESDVGKPMLMINGAYFEYGNKIKGFIPRAKLEGYHWLVPSMESVPLTLKKHGKIYAQLIVLRPKIKITPIVQEEEVRFRIKVSYVSGLYEYLADISYAEMSRIAEDTIREQIMNTYKEGLKLGVDPFELGHHLRLKHPKLWKKLSDNGKELVIHADSIESLDVKVNIINNGKFKLQVK
ncbi:Ger(x)C family spore germination protein [Paenibacillus sinopodophylli]|uniref:Ger(x)C family spore germination protein n=1 Tax=Paenibacillus sinopodophylli TaxID=1837342 RepID=UPI0014868ED6|nr:Ger(x)C family spore germination protein [Paenibacillus sinopodophylli]